MNYFNSRSMRWFAGACLLTALGCGASGPPLAKVEGKVLLDGTPLPSALVLFQPEQGSPSIGKTDREGKFALRFAENNPGALPGKHLVRITSGTIISKPDGADVIVPERVPLKYNDESELTAEVKNGPNQFDFELISGGPVRTNIQ